MEENKGKIQVSQICKVLQDDFEETQDNSEITLSKLDSNFAHSY